MILCKISQNSQYNTSYGVPFSENRRQKRLNDGCPRIPLFFCEFSRTSILQNICEQLSVKTDFRLRDFRVEIK